MLEHKRWLCVPVSLLLLAGVATPAEALPTWAVNAGRSIRKLWKPHRQRSVVAPAQLTTRPIQQPDRVPALVKAQRMLELVYDQIREVDGKLRGFGPLRDEQRIYFTEPKAIYAGGSLRGYSINMITHNGMFPVASQVSVNRDGSVGPLFGGKDALFNSGWLGFGYREGAGRNTPPAALKKVLLDTNLRRQRVDLAKQPLSSFAAE